MDEKSAAVDNEFEEFELLEVDNVDVSIPSQEFKTDLVNDAENDALAPVEIQAMTVLNGENEEKKTKPSHPIKSRPKDRLSIEVEVHSTRRSARQAAKFAKSRRFRNGDERTKFKTKRNIIIKREENGEMDDMQQDCDDIAEGDSDNEFPARDSDNEDWPSQETLDEFPKQIIENGLLLYKGKDLMSMICRFYNLECKQCEKKLRFK